MNSQIAEIAPLNAYNPIMQLENLYSKTQIMRAGELLVIDNIGVTQAEKQLDALKALSYWRACHMEPLDNAVHELDRIVRAKHRNVIVAKRLKRIPSIITKLKRNPSMGLHRMQDIGGCRIILSSIRIVNQVKRALRDECKVQFRVKDYLKNPKDDGYRGVHLIGKFPGKRPNEKFEIEIQLRSKIQHAWATAVEIVDLFTNQKLKANSGKPEWQQFFALTSEAMAALDRGKADSGRHDDICLEVHTLAERLRVIERFDSFNSSLKILEKDGVKGVEGYYLLSIDTNKSTLKYTFFPIAAYDTAVEQYLFNEQISLKTPDLVVALVSTDSLSGLKEAYPNYFADSAVFIEHLRTILARAELMNPNWLTRFFLNFEKK